MKNYGFIFARGGSKGLVGKNIKELHGKPLIQYSIDLAHSIKELDEVFVSTDDIEIAKVSESLGATIIKRPEELATDNSPEWLSWQHAVSWVLENRGAFKNFVSLPTTSPLRSSDDVLGALEKLNATTIADVCIAVTPSHRSPYFNMVHLQDDESVEVVIRPENGHQFFRRQDCKPVFDITTVVYVSTPDFILKHNSLFEGKVTSIEVPRERAIDIDDIYDFKVAQALLEK